MEEAQFCQARLIKIKLPCKIGKRTSFEGRLCSYDSEDTLETDSEAVLVNKFSRKHSRNPLGKIEDLKHQKQYPQIP